MSNTKVAYYNGKTFDSLEEMMEYAKKWPDLPVDLEYFKQFLDQRFLEAQMNVEANATFTNKDLFFLLRMNTDWVQENKQASPLSITCLARHCRNLQTRCLDCGRVVVDRVLPSDDV